LSGIRKKYGTPKCLNCGEEFWQTDTMGRNVHCSRECRWDYQKKNSKAKPKTTEIYYHTCQVCSNLFGSNQPQLKVCSVKCRRAYRKVMGKTYLSTKYKSQSFTCRECGKEWESTYGDKRKLFCSRKCQRKHHKRKYRQSMNQMFANG